MKPSKLIRKAKRAAERKEAEKLEVVKRAGTRLESSIKHRAK